MHPVLLAVLGVLWIVFLLWALSRVPEEPRNDTGEDLQDDEDQAGGLEHVPQAA